MASELKYMAGTAGKADYLICGIDGHVALGIKVLLVPLDPGMFVGLRIRSAKYGGDGVGAPNVQTLSTADKKTIVWTGIDFDNNNDMRCSTVVGLFVLNPVYEAHTLPDAFIDLDVSGDLAKWVMRKIPAAIRILSEAALSEYVLKQLMDQLSSMCPAYGAPKKVVGVVPYNDMMKILKEKHNAGELTPTPKIKSTAKDKNLSLVPGTTTLGQIEDPAPTDKKKKAPKKPYPKKGPPSLSVVPAHEDPA